LVHDVVKIQRIKSNSPNFTIVDIPTLCQTAEDDNDHHQHYHHQHLHHHLHEELDSYGSPMAVPLDSYLGKENIQNRFQSRNLCTLSAKSLLPQVCPNTRFLSFILADQ
jgi:hypothetical protein